MDIHERFVDLHKSLMMLSHDKGFVDRDRSYRLKAILSHCAEQLQVARVSIWKLNEAADKITCELLCQQQEQVFERGAELFKSDYPKYFQSMAANRIINADDACADDRTSEFADSYLNPLDIKSMLDAPIFASGKLYGVVCIEHTKAGRRWDVAEMSYAAAIADTVSLMNEHDLWLETKAKVELMDRTDSLTSLENRRYFQQRLEKDLALENATSRNRLLIIVGLDYFTKLNDLRGSKIADSVLLRLSHRFQIVAHLERCSISRLGGDTFGFWVSELEGAERVNKLIESIYQQLSRPINFSTGETIDITASTGVCIYPQAGYQIDSPIRCAEVALEQAKQKERGSVVYFSGDWLEQIQNKREQEQELFQAFENKELRAFYQPIFHAQTKEIVGLEALVRWRHPDKGILSPFHFLPLMQEMGLINRLGQFMLKQVCIDIKALQSSGQDIKWVSVNLAADQLYNTSLSQELSDLLAEYQLPGSILELEIIEELISQDSELVRAQLTAISELGIRLSIDDFGTGFSSLSRLKHLPVNKLKIDKSFIDGLPDSVDDQCIAQSIIGLAEGMNLDIVAEGVERKEQADWLIAKDCDYLQGYLYSKPISFSELARMLVKA